MTIPLFPSKTNYTNKCSISKLRKNSPFHIFNVTNSHITDDEAHFTVMEKQRTTFQTYEHAKTGTVTFRRLLQHKIKTQRMSS